MKRIVWMAAIVLAAVLGSRMFRASDVAKLQPVEVIRLEMRAGCICVETDTGEVGTGASLREAFADLKAVTAGDIFLDTVEFVLLTEECTELAKELIRYLRPACRICVELGTAELRQVAGFLDVHKPACTLMDCQGQLPRLPALITEEGRMKLVS